MKYLSTCSVLGVVFVMPYHISEAADTIQRNVDHDNKNVIDCEEESKDRTQTGMDRKCLMMFQVGKSPRSKKNSQVPHRSAATIFTFSVMACTVNIIL